MGKKGKRAQAGMRGEAQAAHDNPFRVVRVVLIVVLALLVAGGIAAAVYLNTGYTAGAQAQAALQSGKGVTVTEQDDGDLVFSPADGSAKTGLVFYPGGRVDQKAYAPLMRACAERGVLCILLKMPFNLAVFDQGAATGETDAFPQVKHWYLGGHSLGGAIAAQYAANHADAYEGLFLCAAYSTEDLSNSGLKVLSVYGSDDGVMNRDAYEQDKANVPQMKEDVIEGGCHSYFGDYGLQNGDGTPTITMDEQVRRASDDFAELAGIRPGDD